MGQKGGDRAFREGAPYQKLLCSWDWYHPMAACPLAYRPIAGGRGGVPLYRKEFANSALEKLSTICCPQDIYFHYFSHGSQFVCLLEIKEVVVLSFPEGHSLNITTEQEVLRKWLQLSFTNIYFYNASYLCFIHLTNLQMQWTSTHNTPGY